MGASPGTMGARSRPPGTTDRPDSRQKAPLQRIAPNTRKITQFGSDFISLQKYFASSPRNLAGARSVKVPFGELTLSIWAFPNSSTQSSFPVVRNTPAKERDLNDLKPGLVGKEKRVGQPAMDRSKKSQYGYKSHCRFPGRFSSRFRMRCKQWCSLSSLS
jgi:hypothetical protein